MAASRSVFCVGQPEARSVQNGKSVRSSYRVRDVRGAVRGSTDTSDELCPCFLAKPDATYASWSAPRRKLIWEAGSDAAVSVGSCGCGARLGGRAGGSGPGIRGASTPEVPPDRLC